MLCAAVKDRSKNASLSNAAESGGSKNVRKKMTSSNSFSLTRPEVQQDRNQHQASTVPPKRSKIQLNQTSKTEPLAACFAGNKAVPIYSLSKLVADVKNKSGPATAGNVSTLTKTQVSRLKEVNKLAALTKTTTSIRKSIPTAREADQPKKKDSDDVQRCLQKARKETELRVRDYWDRFTEIKLEKMRQHKLNVEQRMQNNGAGDNYSYYWDNINHCYSDQTQHSRHRTNIGVLQNHSRNESDPSLPPSWYTDNIYSNWSIDLDEEDFRQRSNTNRPAQQGATRLHNSCDINGNSPYRLSTVHGFQEVQVNDSDDGSGHGQADQDMFNNNYKHNNYLVERFRGQLKPTTPTKYKDRSHCVFNNTDKTADEGTAQCPYNTEKKAIFRGIPKSKSFEPEGIRTRRRKFGLGSSFLWQGRRSKTTNLLMDLQSKFRRSGNKQCVGETEYPNANEPTYPAQQSSYYDNFRSAACDRQKVYDSRKDDAEHKSVRRDSGQRNRSLDDDRRSCFNFHHNLLLNSEDGDEKEGELSEAEFRPSHIDYNNNYRRPFGDPSESYYQHQGALNRPPIRPVSLNLNSRFGRGRSLDDYEYRSSRNLNYIDKNLNIVNFLNSARNIPQEFRADGQMPPEILTEQIFNPNVEYRTQLQNPSRSKGGKINRLRNFSSLDLDWETGDTEREQLGILERTSAIFGDLIHSPSSTASVDDIPMSADVLMCPVLDDNQNYLNFISDPEPRPKKSCMKKPAQSTACDFVLHHPQQELDYKLNTYYPQEEFNEPLPPPPPPPLLLSCRPSMDDPDDELTEGLLGMGENFHLDNNCCSSLNNNSNLEATGGNPTQKYGISSNEDEENPHPSNEAQSELDLNTLHIINNIFSIYKPNQYSPVNCHDPTMDNLKVDNYCKKISLPSTMRPLGEPMAGQSKVEMDDDNYLLNDPNNNIVPHDAYDDCFVEVPSALLEGNRRRKSTFFASLKRPLMVVKSKSCHDSIAASDDHWFCSGETSYFYPFDYYLNENTPSSAGLHNTGAKKKSLIKLRSTTRPLSFSH